MITDGGSPRVSERETDYGIIPTNYIFMNHLKEIGLTLLFVMSAIAVYALPAYKMDYVVNIDQHNSYLYVNLDVVFDSPVNETVTLEMPVWAPGYYMIMDFPKYLSDFKAIKADGTALKWTKTSKNQWAVDVEGSILKVSYRVKAQNHSVAESYVEDESVFIAPNGVFMYFIGDKGHKVDVAYIMPEGFGQASTGLKPVGDNTGRQRKFTAPNFDVLFDSPVLLGNQYVERFSHEGHDYEFAILTPEGYDETTFRDDFKKMVSETSRIIGDVPYDNYCLIHLGQGGGGLEHLNSQACYTGGSYKFRNRNDYLRHLSFVTHEYFHLYNVKSIRPFELGPFDYSHECYTPLLWVSEGFTCYYENRILLGCGIIDGEYMLNDLSGSIRTVETAEGHKHMSLRQSSYDIWLNFFNQSENVISYYDKGPVFGLFFDIEIRRLTNCEKGLDDLMRLLYNRYYKELQRGFTEEEFWQAAKEVAGQELTLLRRYVDTTDDIDYEALLAPAGLSIDRSTWTLYKLDKADRQQLKIRKAIIAE